MWKETLQIALKFKGKVCSLHNVKRHLFCKMHFFPANEQIDIRHEGSYFKRQCSTRVETQIVFFRLTFNRLNDRLWAGFSGFASQFRSLKSDKIYRDIDIKLMLKP